MKSISHLAALAAATGILVGCGETDTSASGGPPPAFPVQVANPTERELALTEVYTGRFVPVEQVELRAKVSGYLESVHFEEGQKVEKGDLMFQIDPRPFDTQVEAAAARVGQANARLSLAESNLGRAERLVASNAISQEEAEIRRSELAQAEADLVLAQAEERSATLQRQYADVKAPISGIASKFYITPGNFVSGGAPGSTLLTTIVPHHPIHCQFEVDERQVLKFTRMFFEGKTEGREGEHPTVQIAVSDEEEFEFEGVIDFSDNRLDESTATIQLRVLVQNEDEFLTPGLFARVRVPIGDPFVAILVPDAVLGFDQSKRFAWVLQEDNTVRRTFVETGPLEGDQRIITSGLELSDRIVTSGIQLLQDGMPVAPMDGAPPAQEEETPEPDANPEGDEA